MNKRLSLVLSSAFLALGAFAGCKVEADLSIEIHGLVQAVPPEGTAGVPSTSPILVFADSLNGTTTYKVEETVLGATSDITSKVVMNKVTSGANKDIYIFSATGGFTLGSSVKVTLSGSVAQVVTFNVSSTALADVTEYGFESSPQNLPSGWAGFGDIGIIAQTGSLAPTEGSYQLALSTGEAVDPAGSGAVAGTSSLIASGDMDTGGAQSLHFDYNFQSSEFDDYCASDYDDTFVVVASGPNGAIAKVVTSVNIVCAANGQSTATFPGLPDGGDDVYSATGTESYTLDISKLGTPINVAYIVTDVGDSILSSVAGVDHLTFQ